MQATQPQPNGACPARPAQPHPPSLLAWTRLARVYGKVQQHSARDLRRFGLTVARFDADASTAHAPADQRTLLALLRTLDHALGALPASE